MHIKTIPANRAVKAIRAISLLLFCALLLCACGQSANENSASSGASTDAQPTNGSQTASAAEPTITSTVTEIVVTPTPTETSVTPTPTETPVLPTIDTPTPVFPTIITPTPTETPVTPTPTETPITPTPVTPTPTETPVTPTPTETPVTPTPTETPEPPRNDLRDFFTGDVRLVLPEAPGVYLLNQLDTFREAVENATGVILTQTSADEPADEGAPELHFGLTADTPSSLKKGLDTADYVLSVSDNKLYLAVGSDYALGRAAAKIAELLNSDRLILPYTDRAAEEEQVKIIRAATFNIQNGAGVAHVFKKLASAIRSSGADIIGLQEVDMNTGRNGRKDTMKELADLLGFQYYEFSKAIDFSGGEYGSGVLSRYPIVSYETISLPRGGGDEGRSCGHAVINVNGVRIDFFNTHLTLSDSNRPNQWATIVGKMTGLEHVILTGDLNRDGTEDYDYFFGKDYNYVNGNNVIGFTEGCELVDEHPEQELTDAEIVERLYALENGQALEGTYTLTGVVKGVVNTYLDSDRVTVRIVVDGMKDKQITCYKLKSAKTINEGDTITVTGSLINLVYKNEHTPDVSWYDSCPGYGALDNVISAPFFTQLNYKMENKRAYSDHYMLWADLAFPRSALEGDGFGESGETPEN